MKKNKQIFFFVLSQLTICKSQRHFVSAAAAILKEVSLGLNLTQSRWGCTVVCQEFWSHGNVLQELGDSRLSFLRHMAESIDSQGAEQEEVGFHRHSRWLSLLFKLK